MIRRTVLASFLLLIGLTAASAQDAKILRVHFVGNQRMKAGELPGHTEIKNVFANGIHLNNVGSYGVGCTYFATLYRENPKGLPAEPYKVTDPKLAEVLQDTVWKVVSTTEVAGVAKCQLTQFTAEGQPHGFFNRPPWQEQTTHRMDEFLVSVGHLEDKATTKGDPRFDITTRKAEDRIEAEVTDEATFFTVTSPSGIGGATVSPKDGKWSGKFVLRLRLKGLESLTISHEQVTLGASFSSHGDSEWRVYLKEGGQENALGKDSKYWMEIKVVGGKEVPLNSGHFEMVLPAAIFKSQPKAVTIRWIDFYRG